MKIHTLPVGLYQANCYIIESEKYRSGIIIDPGDNAEKIKRYIDKLNITSEAVLITHAHFDHIKGLNNIHGIEKIYLHEADKELFNNVEMQGIMLKKIKHDIDFINDGDLLEFKDISAKVIYTPGHSPGSCCFLIGDNLFSGDTLFKLGIGRTDLWGGSYSQIISSIFEKLFILDDSVRVYPGHGETTTIGEEKRNNPFLNR